MSEERKRILGMLADGKISVDEAERLLAALGDAPGETASRPPAVASGKPKFLRVLLSAEAGGESVDLRVPLAVIRSGMKLGALIPEQAVAQVDSALKAKGVPFDLAGMSAETIEELAASLAELQVDIRGDNGERVQVFCE